MSYHTLTFTGELTVQCAEDVCQKLAEALEKHVIVEVNCADSTDMDVSFIQLVVAARKSAEARGGQLRLSPISPLLSATLARCGVQFSSDSSIVPAGDAP